MTTFRSASIVLTMLGGLTLPFAAHAQSQPASAPASAPPLSMPASGAKPGNKAAMPPTDAAASQSGVATKKPAKPGAQSGPKPASSPQ